MLLLGLTGCQPGCDNESAPAEPAVAEQAEASSEPGPPRIEDVFVPTRTTRIGYEDTEPIEIIEAVEVPTKFERRDPGKPTVLMTAKHLRLGHEFPLAENRGFVEVLDGPGRDAAVLSAHLVDFETGPVLEVAEVYYGQYRKFGVARAQMVVDGKRQEVLVHADGHVVPWRQGVFEDAFLNINAGTGQAFVFIDEDDTSNTKYSHWTDLREPPPPPTFELPFHFAPTRERHPDKLESPPMYNPGRVPTLVWSRTAPDHCPKVELRDDGTPICVPASYEALADGWRIDPGFGEGQLVNVSTGEVVVLEGNEECSLTQDVVATPPRAMFMCNGFGGHLYLWSPSKTARIPWFRNFETPTRSRSNHNSWVPKIPERGAAPAGSRFTDFVTQRIVETNNANPLAPKTSQDIVPYTRDEADSGLFVLDLRSAAIHRQNHRSTCTSFQPLALDDTLLIYLCLDRQSRPIWTEALDVRQQRRWKLPPLRQAWLQRDPAMLVGTHRAASKDHLLIWSLTSP